MTGLQPCLEFEVCDKKNPTGEPLLGRPISARLPSDYSDGVKYWCAFKREENNAFKDMLKAIAAAHPKKVTYPFPKTGFSVELDKAGHWVHKPRSGVNSSVTEFYSLRLVNQFVGIKPA